MSYEVWGEPDDGPELPEGWLDEEDAQELRDRITELEAKLASTPAPVAIDFRQLSNEVYAVLIEATNDRFDKTSEKTLEHVWKTLRDAAPPTRLDVGDARDAARYRYLQLGRPVSENALWIARGNPHVGLERMIDIAADEALDAAMLASPPTGKDQVAGDKGVAS